MKERIRNLLDDLFINSYDPNIVTSEELDEILKYWNGELNCEKMNLVQEKTRENRDYHYLFTIIGMITG